MPGTGLPRRGGRNWVGACEMVERCFPADRFSPGFYVELGRPCDPANKCVAFMFVWTISLSCINGGIVDFADSGN